MVDTMLEMPVTCVGTAASTVGATCALNTTLDALIPGLVREKDRAIWQLGQVTVRDAGPNGSGYGAGCPSDLRGRRRGDLPAAGNLRAVDVGAGAWPALPYRFFNPARQPS